MHVCSRYVYVYLYECVHMQVHTCLWKTDVKIEYISFDHLPILSLKLEFMIQGGWLTSELQGSPVAGLQEYTASH